MRGRARTSWRSSSASLRRRLRGNGRPEALLLVHLGLRPGDDAGDVRILAFARHPLGRRLLALLAALALLLAPFAARPLLLSPVRSWLHASSRDRKSRALEKA